MAFLLRLFGVRAAPPPRPAPIAPLAASTEPPAWAEALTDHLQKLSRSHSRLALRIEDLETKVEGGFADLRGTFRDASKRADAAPPFELFDTLDALDEACLTSRATQPELADGLERVVRRLEALALAPAFTRVRPLGQVPDGRWFKVAGTILSHEVDEGLVARVVRAAVTTRDGTLVREGEVLTARKAP
jgi:hypothetical protein